MAYADKSCDMRRCCLAKGGHVEFEGVEIDGCRFLLRNRKGWGEFPASINTGKDKINKVIEEFNSDLEDGEEPMILLYQDNEECNWDVKKDYVLNIAEDKI